MKHKVSNLIPNNGGNNSVVDSLATVIKIINAKFMKVNSKLMSTIDKEVSN